MAAGRDGDGRLRGRMRALADRSNGTAAGPSSTLRARRLAADYVRRPERRIRAGVGDHTGSGSHDRAVIVKVLYHDRARGAFPNTTRALANYMAKQGPLFDRTRTGIDPAIIAADWAHDRRVFHVIVSPDDGHRLDDPVDWARTVVAAWERRTGPLAWVGAVETKPDAAHPADNGVGGNRHLHVMIRGVQDGHDMRLDRDLIRYGLRADAVRVTTDRLGLLTERERLALQDRLLAAREREVERNGERER